MRHGVVRRVPHVNRARGRTPTGHQGAVEETRGPSIGNDRGDVRRRRPVVPAQRIVSSRDQRGVHAGGGGGVPGGGGGRGRPSPPMWGPAPASRGGTADTSRASFIATPPGDRGRG